MTTKTAPRTATCRRCCATLRSAKSVAAGIGPTCARKERREAATRRHNWICALDAASLTADLSAFRDAKAVLAKAQQLIEDEAIIGTRHESQYLVSGSDGVSTYLTDTIEKSCTCKAGQRLGRCNHLVAADILDRATVLIAA